MARSVDHNFSLSESARSPVHRWFTRFGPAAFSPYVKGRDLRLDLLRGFAVFAMIVDHTGGPSPLYAITGGNRFFVSAAEGFVFISGLLVGIVYGREARTAGWRSAAAKSLQRAFVLYALNVWLTLAFALFSTLLRLPWAPDPREASVGVFILETMTLQRVFYLSDVMQLYALLLLATPAALWLLHGGRWLPLLGSSLALWGAYHVSNKTLQIPWPIKDNAVFNFAAWQVLFFVAMVVGYERDRFTAQWRCLFAHRSFRFPGGWLGPLIGLLTVMLYLHVTDAAVLGAIGLVGDPADALDSWFDKSSLPPLRLLAVVIVFAFAWTLVSRCWPVVYGTLGWLLLPLGTRALSAYVSHTFVAGAAVGLVRSLETPGPSSGALAELNQLKPGSPPELNAAIQIAAVIGIWLLNRWTLPPRLVSWLGHPPVRWSANPPVDDRLARARQWHATPSLMALGVASVVGVSTLSVAWPDLTRHVPIASNSLAQTAAWPQIEVTAVPKRRIADLAPTREASVPADDTHGEARELAGRVTATDCARSKLEDRTFYSPTLDRVMPYGIYLPPGYCADTDRRYPVVYLLHGGPTNYSEWPQLRITDLVDDLIAAGEVEPMILVFPEGESSYFFNHPGGPAWGDYIAHDLVAVVDSSERTRSDRASRVIAGLSMGGHGALQLGFNYPEVFGIIAAHGPALRDTEDGPEFFGTPEDYAPFDPLHLVATVNQPPLALWIDVPEEDPWLEKTERIHRILIDRGWPHTYRINPGTHSTLYWLAHLTDYVRFYAEALRSAPTRGRA